MITKTKILSTAERLDEWIPRFTPVRLASRRRLVALVIHTLYQQPSDADCSGSYPHERMTVDSFRLFLEAFLAMGYSFVSPADLLTSERLPERAMMLTFDDGYYNFVHILPLLQEYSIPVTLFVCPGYLVEPQSFWWDAFYRHARKDGVSDSRIRRQLGIMRTKSFADVHRLIVDRWGQSAFDVATDVDRPLKLDELKDIANDPHVHLGNHTFNHVSLPFRTESEMTRELTLAHTFLEREFGSSLAVSYPNGDHSTTTRRICRQLGYQLGMTIEPRWNRHPQDLSAQDRLMLGRFMISGERDIYRQANSVNRWMSVTNTIRRCKRHCHD